MIEFLFAAIAAMKLIQGFQAFNQQRQAGTLAKEAGEYQNTLAMRRAQSMEQRANEERASAQRRMMEQRRQARYVSSRARAVGAASGASLDSPMLVNIAGDIETEAQFRSDMERFKGEQAGRGLEYQAQIERIGGLSAKYQGKVEDRLAKQRATQALLSGVTGAAQTAAGAYMATNPNSGSDYEMGNFQTQTIAQSSMSGGTNSLFAKYGQGGYSQSVYP